MRPRPDIDKVVIQDNRYFSLVHSGSLWDGLVQARAVRVFVPSEIAEPQMELCGSVLNKSLACRRLWN